MRKSKKSELELQLDKAKESERYMVAIWSLEEGQLNLYRVTHQFPVKEMEAAIRLLKEALEKVAVKKPRPMIDPAKPKAILPSKKTRLLPAPAQAKS